VDSSPFVVTGSPIIGAIVWFLMLGFGGFILWRLRSRRRHVGSAATGTVYDMLNEEKRNAVEIIVEDKAAERDEEHADDTLPDPKKRRG
jgi:hypothetical protein